MNAEAPLNHNRRALQRGTCVQEFEIMELVGGGGFGIVYLARDLALGRRVALKEYMPPHASRVVGTTQVVANSERDTDPFSRGLRSFVNEARLLARFDHPALVKVHRFWEENGTAYMVMPFYEGPTLRRAVAEKLVPTDETSLRHLLLPLLDALAALHRENCFHRDISPDNILLTPTGPVLLDFGAARLVLGDASQTLTVILKEGYAPVEQYAEEVASPMRQGPWTDIYALCGVVRYAVTGTKPLSAVARMAATVDPLPPLSQLAAARYSRSFLSAIDTGMAIRPEDRPQSIEKLGALLDRSSLLRTAAGVQKKAAQSGAAETFGPAGTAFGGPQPSSTATLAARRTRWAPVLFVLLALLALTAGITRYRANRQRAVPQVPGGVPGPVVQQPAPDAPQPALALSQDLALLLEAAAANAWTQVNQHAMAITKTAPIVPPGDRRASRLANDAGLKALAENNIPAAVSAFAQGDVADPSDIEVVNNHAYALTLSGDKAEAQKVLLRVLERDPTRSVAWASLAEARSENVADASAALKLALHFSLNREQTLARFREMAQKHPDPRLRDIAATVLQQSDRVPTVPGGVAPVAHGK
jgi:tetratricopeptide (TPR) repeat protein